MFLEALPPHLTPRWVIYLLQTQCDPSEPVAWQFNEMVRGWRKLLLVLP